MRAILMLAILSGCATPKKEYVYVDMETYMKWGTKNLVPIGTREIPPELSGTKMPAKVK
jgi:hypothetical protein